MHTKALILAAGLGKRMHSTTPKVAHELLGKPLINWVVDACKSACCDQIHVVLGHGRESVEPLISGCKISYQNEMLGTGHTVMCAKDSLGKFNGTLLVLCGDTPLISANTLKSLIAKHNKYKASCTILTMKTNNPTGYGRIVKANDGTVEKIVEQKDCTKQQAEINEVNSGAYCFNARDLLDNLDKLTRNNAQKEYYLTDMVAILRKLNKKVISYTTKHPEETLGVNSRKQLAQVTKIAQKKINDKFLEKGVTFLDENLAWIGPDVQIQEDVEILPNTIIYGKTKISSGTKIGPNCLIKDCQIGKNCTIDTTHAYESNIKNNVNCGPRAYIRPGTYMCNNSKAGTSVEIKNSKIGEGSKVPHLSYIGDATIGKNVNVGAGSITCNYDGKNKFKTIIEDNVFIGSDTMLVAPVKIRKNSIVGAGSTITKDVDQDSLAIGRSQQIVKKDWVIRRKRKKK